MIKRLILLIGLISLYTSAQVTQDTFDSFKLQETRDLMLYVPENYSEEKKYPLILVLDAENLFDLAVANTKFFASQHLMPEAIIVGINQGKDNLRWEDCDFDKNSGLPTDLSYLFYDFIKQELLPYLNKSYRLAPFRMLVGYDITANFGNYFLFENDALFSGYLIISPIMAYEMENRLPSRLAALDQEIFYNLVLEKEKSKYRDQILQLNDGLQTLNKSNVHYFFDEYETPDHVSIVAHGFGQAYDNIFSVFKPISPKEYKEEMLKSEVPVFQYLTDKYDMIEKLFGFTKQVELNDVMATYAAALKKEDYTSLEGLSKLCKKEYPESMIGHYFEGEYLEFIGQPKKAMKAFEKAFMFEEIDFLTKDMALEKVRAIKEDFGY